MKYLGSGKKNRAAAAVLPLPPADTTRGHPACIPVAVTEPRLPAADMSSDSA
jgi:hypothetical protein